MQNTKLMCSGENRKITKQTRKKDFALRNKNNVLSKCLSKVIIAGIGGISILMCFLHWG